MTVTELGEKHSEETFRGNTQSNSLSRPMNGALFRMHAPLRRLLMWVQMIAHWGLFKKLLMGQL